MAKYDVCQCGAPKRSCSIRCSACHFAAKRVPDNNCVDCGDAINRIATRCRPCAYLARRGRRLHPSGYIQVVAHGHPLADKRGRVLEHRKIVHDAGIAIPQGHHVHHRNGDRTDNRLENLEVLPASQHVRDHAWKRGWITNQFGTFQVREHGLSPYRRGCRCDVCRKANTDYCREAARKRLAREAA